MVLYKKETINILWKGRFEMKNLKVWILEKIEETVDGEKMHVIQVYPEESMIVPFGECKTGWKYKWV